MFLDVSALKVLGPFTNCFCVNDLPLRKWRIHLNLFTFQKLWDDLKNLLVSIRESSEMDCNLRQSLYNWGLSYM